jgi:hypothetical protein
MVMIPAIEVAATVSMLRAMAYRVTAARNRPKMSVMRSRVEVDMIFE